MPCWTCASDSNVCVCLFPQRSMTGPVALQLTQCHSPCSRVLRYMAHVASNSRHASQCSMLHYTPLLPSPNVHQPCNVATNSYVLSNFMLRCAVLQVKKRGRWLHRFSLDVLSKLPGTAADPFDGVTVDTNSLGAQQLPSKVKCSVLCRQLWQLHAMVLPVTCCQA
jgi:hypothetical protein